MKSRITWALVLSVALVVLFAGFGVLIVGYRTAQTQNRALLTKTARTIAAAELTHPSLTPTIIRIARLDGAFIRGVTGNGTVRGSLPATIPAQLASDAIATPGVVVTIDRGNNVYVGIESLRSTGTGYSRIVGILVILTRTVKIAGRSVLYLLLIALLGICAAAIAAETISRRITSPLKELQSATRRIAGGDLNYRMRSNAHHYPEIEDLSTSVNQMAEALEASRQSERKFLMAVSHDLRTPLTSITGFSEAILDGTTEDPRAAAAVIHRESKRLERMVRDLLELSKLQAQRFSLHKSPTDISAIAVEVAEVFSLRAAEAGLEFNFEPLDRVIVVDLDADRLIQILQNLLENAYKFAKSKIYLTVALVDQSHAVFTIGDDGPGIAESDRSKIFVSAHRNESIPSRTPGTGVGLLIVSELAKSMDLRVGFKSPTTQDGGTEMAVVIGFT